jgi:DcuC family C4-dicarboxylate transporter
MNMMDWIVIIIVLAVLIPVVYGVIKDYNPQAVLTLAGMLLLAISAIMGINEILPDDQSTGFVPFDLFERLKNIFSSRAAGLGLTIMAVGGFATYMSHIGASQALVRVAVKPVSRFKSPYIVLAFSYLVCVFLSLFVNSATGLGLLLMVTMYPVLRNIGLSAASACGVIVTAQAFEIGPTQANLIFAAEQSSLTPVEYFVNHQIWVVVPMVIVTMVLHYLWQRYCDRRDGWNVEEHKGDHTELEQAAHEENVLAPNWYAWLPVIPFVLVLVFSKLLVTNVSMNVVVAMLISIFVSMIFEMFRHKSLKPALSGYGSFLDGMGKVFGPVVGLIVAAQLFAESLIGIGAIDTMLDLATSAGLNALTVTLVMVGLITFAALIMGSGNASFLSFASLAPDVAAKIGIPAVQMLLPMQLASSIGRSFSPIAAVVIACANIASISPFTIIKRSCVPMVGSLIVALVLNYILFM